MRTFLQDLRYAARTMQRNPGFTALAILALALGIGANTAVFTVLNGVLLRPLPFPEPERLQLISYTVKGGPFGPRVGLSEDFFLTVQKESRAFENVASFNRTRTSLTGSGEPVRLSAANVTATFFNVLRVQPMIGRTFLAEDLQGGRDPVVLLGEQLWRTRFGAAQNSIGEIVKLDGVGHRIIGIMPAGFNFPNSAQLWTPMELRATPGNSFSRPVVGRLRPGHSPEAALSEFQAIASRLDTNPSPRNPPVAEVLPLKELLVGGIRESLWIFAGAVAFVLLIACANVANLLLMRASSRRQEIAVRAAMGAGRWRLVRQLLTESTLISLAGGLAGILVALWGVPALLAIAPGRIPRAAEIQIDGTVLAFTLAVALLTGLIFGLAPALHATRRELRDTLSLSGRAVSGHGGLRSALVVAEIALALVLLAGAGLMLKSFMRMRAVNPGFETENVLAMSVEVPLSVYRTAAEVQSFHERVLARLAAMPGIASVGAVNFRPMGPMRLQGDFQIQSGTFPHDFTVDKLVISPAYFRSMNIRLVAGRDFSDRDRADAPGVVIVSQSAARAVWPGEDPIGKRITEARNPRPQDWSTVVGVVDDVHQWELTTNLRPALYHPYLQMQRTGWLSSITYTARTAVAPASLAPAMRTALREVDPNQPVESLATMQDLVALTTAEPLLQARLLTVFSILALVLAAIGIYGVLAHAVTTRTREIGIRMALGAESRDVMGMVLRRTMILAAIGVAIGTAGALAATRVLSNLLFEVKPTDAGTFIAVSLVLLAVAFTAGWIPARRATRVDPLVALRYE